ncbi:MAG: ATP synthase F1 subunit gamma [Flavobacteriales bacterium]|nr:ATP synthase F1 subunit gamma [Flavobacteriales bacterium]
MPNLKEVRNRISSVNSTKQITSAMKLVSAAKLKKAQDAITRMRPYANKLKEILSNLSQSMDASEGIYSRHREVKNVLLVVVTSNRGLCGAFNANVIKKANQVIETNYAKQLAEGKVQVITIGKKATSYFSKKQRVELLSSHDELFGSLTFESVIPVAEKAMNLFVEGKVDKVEFIYNQFKSAGTQLVTHEQFLPVLPPTTGEKTSTSSQEYIFEPSKAEIVENLIPLSLKTQFFKVLLDSHAAEHGARMTAMHKATDNASELLRNLKLSYNKARQAAITNEILEIVAGAEALKG